MNNLPPHRSALSGRTHSRRWVASDYDPISVPPKKTVHPAERFFLPLLIIIVVLLAWGWL